MAYKLFPHLPVADLERSRSFYQALGWRTAPGTVEGHSLVLDLGEAFGVTLVERRGGRPAAARDQRLADPCGAVTGCCTLVVDIPEDVDVLADRAVAAGAAAEDRADDHHTSRRTFADPDGHRWTIVWLDPLLTTQE
ncbi:VOC family protein [Kocuria sp. CPCC 205268]|uniref:VOC family protein n=1 Tax=Kocuria oxytropis TaxID=3058913 RepID=UPI0034D60547